MCVCDSASNALPPQATLMLPGNQFGLQCQRPKPFVQTECHQNCYGHSIVNDGFGRRELARVEDIRAYRLLKLDYLFFKDEDDDDTSTARTDETHSNSTSR